MEKKEEYLDEHRAEVFHLVTGHASEEQIHFFEESGFSVNDVEGGIILSGDEIDYYLVMPAGHLSNWPRFGRLFELPKNIPGSSEIELALSCSYDFERDKVIGLRGNDENQMRILLDILKGKKETEAAAGGHIAIIGLHKFIMNQKNV